MIQKKQAKKFPTVNHSRPLSIYELLLELENKIYRIKTLGKPLVEEISVKDLEDYLKSVENKL